MPRDTFLQHKEYACPQQYEDTSKVEIEDIYPQQQKIIGKVEIEDIYPQQYEDTSKVDTYPQQYEDTSKVDIEDIYPQQQKIMGKVEIENIYPQQQKIRTNRNRRHVPIAKEYTRQQKQTTSTFSKTSCILVGYTESMDPQ